MQEFTHIKEYDDISIMVIPLLALSCTGGDAKKG
jgi:hypothetical protein